ncbi:MAG: AmmeMemoRadiSam system protein B [Syntrophobacteraceae bacterium]|nr:AmmeMemoRadiSam system protein B [Desulfobacteraceae bacterium]
MKKTRISAWPARLPAICLFLALCTGTSGLCASETMTGQVTRIREPAIAGTWYPAAPDSLRKQVEAYLDGVPEGKNGRELAALIVPHAGYVYSGQVAAWSYKLLRKRKYSTVVVIGPSHHAAFRGVATYEGAGFRTPLGVVPLDSDLIALLQKRSERIRSIPEAHEKEHSIEIQLPFLQVVQPGFRLVPLVMGEQDFAACRELADVLADAIRGKPVLVVASSDLSHFHSYEEARALDQVVVRKVESFDPHGLGDSLARKECEACGGGPIIVAMLTAARLGANGGQVLRYANSGDVTGRKSGPEGVVGYMAAALWSGRPGKVAAPAAAKTGDKNAEPGLSAGEKALLHRIAKEAVEAGCRGVKPAKDYVIPPRLKEPRGAFVTIQKNGRLRGCIGYIVAVRPLAEAISEMAAAAAFNDPRFSPVTEDELKDLSYEISVLTPLRRVENVEEIRVGTHGIYIKRGGAAGLLLPQVATEYGWDRETFLEQTCLKAGLPRDAWKDGETEIHIFSAEIF